MRLLSSRADCDSSQNYTLDMNHDYTPEQKDSTADLMDKFPEVQHSCSMPRFRTFGTGRGNRDGLLRRQHP